MRCYMPSEILERIHEQVAYYERTRPLEDPAERREREFEKRKRELAEARKAREAETASTNWYAAVDTRIRTHFKDWAWAAIDERIQQHLDRHEDIFKDAVGAALATIRKRMCDELKGADEELQRALEAKLAVLEERLASNDRIL